MPKIAKILNFTKLLRSHKKTTTDLDRGDRNDLNQSNCIIYLIDESQLKLHVKPTTKGRVVFKRICEHLNLFEAEYFGLRFIDSQNQAHWLDIDRSVGSQFKCPVSQKYTFYFGVKFYSADPCKLNEEITRYLFFLQVKNDILQGRLPVKPDLLVELCALAVQSDLGDFDPVKHSEGYVSEFRFVPDQGEDLEYSVSTAHAKLRGVVPGAAEYRYLDRVKWLEMYGVDMHPVTGDNSVEYFLGLTPTGVVTYRNGSKVGNYFWPRITKITFKSRIFSIRSKDRNGSEITYTFSVSTKQACKHLWKCCVEHHSFFRFNSSMKMQQLNTGNKFFSFGSKHRHSGRSERQVLADISNRTPAPVQRTPSRRHQRRNSTERKCESMIENPYSVIPGTPDQSVYNKRPASPSSIKSAPWTSGVNLKGGLYTSGRDSPLSVRSDKMKFPKSAKSGSESESTHYHHRRKRESESENEGRRHRIYRPNADSESECDVLYRRHRRRGKSLENVGNWRSGQNPDAHNESDFYKGAYDATNGKLRQNGSLSSVATEMSQVNRNIELAAMARRRRRRSRSPSAKPPEELAQHFKYVDPEQMTEEEMRQFHEIQFTSVESSVDPLKHTRHRNRSPKRKSYGEPFPQQQPPTEEAPPPYSDTEKSSGLMRGRTSSQNLNSKPPLSTASQQDVQQVRQRAGDRNCREVTENSKSRQSLDPCKVEEEYKSHRSRDRTRTQYRQPGVDDRRHVESGSANLGRGGELNNHHTERCHISCGWAAFGHGG